MKRRNADAMKSVSSVVHEMLSKKEAGYRFSLADLHKETGARSYAAVSAFVSKMKTRAAIKVVETIKEPNTSGRGYAVYELVDLNSLASRDLWVPRNGERGPAKAVEKREISTPELEAQVIERTTALTLVEEEMTTVDQVRHLMNAAIDQMALAERLLHKLSAAKTLDNATTSEIIEELHKRVK